MQEAWLQMQCPECEENWEEKVTALSAPDTAFTCDACGTSRPLSEFMKTSRDLEILEQFQ